MKEIVYIDMDDTMCDFMGAFHLAIKANPFIKYPQSQYGFFTNLKPIPGAIEGYNTLSNSKYDVYILTRPSILNPLCYTEKRIWIENHLGLEACNKLIISPNKSLNKGHYLIDDQPWDFDGEQIRFGADDFPNWESVIKYLM